MVLLTYRHGLRMSELIDIRLRDLDLDAARIYVRRCKGSLSTTQPIEGDELRAVRAYLRERDKTKFPYLLIGERGPFTRQAVNYLLKELGQRAKLDINVRRCMCLLVFPIGEWEIYCNVELEKFSGATSQILL